MELALEQETTDEAIRYAKFMLEETQQLLHPKLQAALATSHQSWEESKEEQAVRSLYRALALAKKLNYL